MVYSASSKDKYSTNKEKQEQDNGSQATTYTTTGSVIEMYKPNNQHAIIVFNN